jgi:NAD(P)-dependent dehydrogenase (short-subunit alcohol dehydrogenase family)
MFDWRRVDSYCLAGRVVAVTGATSGLGLATAEQLAHDGATVVAVGRNPDKTAQVVQQLRDVTGNPNVSAAIADMGDYDSVRRASEQILADHDRLDGLIHNAGALSHRRTSAPDGTETTIAGQIVGPFLLTCLLLDRLRESAPARVITMSSGGMYTAQLTVEHLQMDEASYNGSKQYALAKRATPGVAAHPGCIEWNTTVRWSTRCAHISTSVTCPENHFRPSAPSSDHFCATRLPVTAEIPQVRHRQLPADTMVSRRPSALSPG